MYPVVRALPSWLAAVAVSAFATYIVLPLFPSSPSYSELIAGYITWGDGDKGRDYLAILCFLLVFALSMWSLSRLQAGLTARSQGEASRYLAGTYLLVALVPAAIWLGVGFQSGFQAFFAGAAITGLLVVLFMLTAAGLLAYRMPLAEQTVHVAFQEVYWTALLVPGAVLAVVTLWVRGFLADVPSFQPTRVAGALAVVVVLVVAGIRLTARTPDGWSHRLRWLVLALQLPLPLLLLSVVPAPWLVNDQLVHGYQHQPVLKWLLGLMIMGALASWTWRALRLIRSGADGDLAPSAWLDPFCLAAAVVYLRTSLVGLPVFGADDFHMGELLYGWQQLHDFGRVPYVDLDQVHGLRETLGGFVADALFGTTAAAILPANQFIAGLSGAALFLIVYPLAGPGAAFVTAFLFPIDPAYRLIVLALPLLAYPRLLGEPVRWLAVWLIIGYAAVLYTLSTGTAFVLGSMPFALYLIHAQYRRDRLRLARWAGGALVVLLLLWVLTPLGPVTLGMLRFVLENSAINATAFGIPWFWTSAQGIQPQHAATLFGIATVFNLFRLGSLALAVWAGTRALQLIRSPADERRPQALWLYGTLALLPVFLIPYAFGRIDPGALSRSGQATMAMAGLLFVALLVEQRLQPRAGGAVVLATALVLGLFGVPESPQVLLAKPTHIVLTTPQTSADAAAQGLPKVGTVKFNPPRHLDDLIALRKELGKLLRPGETFYDLTDRTALYYYLDYPIPAQEAAFYTAVTRRMQLRTLRKFAAAPPPVVLIDFKGSNQFFDGGVPSLRAYWIYRHFALSYLPVRRGGFTFLVEPDRARSLPPVDPAELGGELQLDTLTDPNWQKGISRYPAPDVLLRDEPWLSPGDIVAFAGSGNRRVRRVQGRVLFLEGPALDVDRDGSPHAIRVVQRHLPPLAEQRLRLLERPFGLMQLGSLPVAWGRSGATLAPELEAAGTLRTTETAAVHSLEPAPDGLWRTTGADPYLVFDLARLNVRGEDISLVEFEFACLARSKLSPPSLKIYWATATERDFSESKVVVFNSVDGRLLAPLDHNPRWLLGGTLSFIRINVGDGADCTRFRLGDIRLLRRRALDGPR